MEIDIFTFVVNIIDVKIFICTIFYDQTNKVNGNGMTVVFLNNLRI